MSPDAAITRWARTTGGSSWQIVFFRMSMTCVLNLVVTSYLANEPLKLLKDLTRKAYPLGLLAIAAALVAGESIGYIFSFLNDETASAVLLTNLNPVWAAIMGYVVLREELLRRDFALLCVGAAVVGVMFFTEWWSSPTATQTTTSTTSQLNSPFVGDREAANLELAVIEDTQAATPIGILVALMTGVCVAALLTFSRYVEKACPQGKPALLVAPCVGNFFAVLTSLCSMLLLGPTKAGGIWNQGTDGPTFLALSAASACFDAAFYVGVILAPQYITASEIALVLLLEVFFAPLWVYLLFGDLPATSTIICGVVLISALGAREGLIMHETLLAGKDIHVGSLASSLEAEDESDCLLPSHRPKKSP